MKRQNIGHFVAMRFGIGIYDEAWLEHRLALLRATMLPSLRAQSAKFFFTVFMDDNHPIILKNAVLEVVSQLDNSEVKFVQLLRDCKDAHRQDIEEKCAELGLEYFISTRVDDDDALTGGAMEAIQRRAERMLAVGQVPAGIAVRSGLQYLPSGNVGVWQEHGSIAIGLSVLGRSGDPGLHAFGFNHMKMKAVMEARGGKTAYLDRKEACWMYTLHKYSDTRFVEKSERVLGNPDKVYLAPEELSSFGLDMVAMERWLEIERQAKPIPGERMTWRMIDIEEKIDALRGGSRDEIEVLLAEQLSAALPDAAAGGFFPNLANEGDQLNIAYCPSTSGAYHADRDSSGASRPPYVLFTGSSRGGGAMPACRQTSSPAPQHRPV